MGEQKTSVTSLEPAIPSFFSNYSKQTQQQLKLIQPVFVNKKIESLLSEGCSSEALALVYMK